MREATLILPLKDNDGADLSAIHAILRAELVQTFGGFSAAALDGAWMDEESGRIFLDNSTEYRIAAAWTDRERSKLERIATCYAREAGQLALYVRHGDGEVAFYGPGLDVEEVAAPIYVEDYAECAFEARKGHRRDRLDNAAKFDRARLGEAA